MYHSVRKGFTLIELMIVIVMVTIFASVFMVIASEMSSTARANKIISNLNSLKMAALILINERREEYSKLTVSELNNKFQTKTQKHYITSKYIDRGLDAPDSKNNLLLIPESRSWYVRYDASNESERVRQKLTGRTKKNGLEGYDAGNVIES